MNDYYKILNSKKSDSLDDIKKSYRKLQFEYHPDRGGDKVMFIKINKAYDFISKNHKKEKNKTLSNNLKNDIHIKNYEKNELKIKNIKKKPKTIIKIVNISMEDAYFGKKLPIEIERWYIENNEKYNEKEKIYIDLYKGIDDNEIIILKNKGHVLNNENKGDVKVIIKIKNNSFYKRNGLDLIYEKTLTLKEAILGYTFNIKHLSGKIYEIKSERFNKRKEIKNMGFKRGEYVGDLIINFNIDFPTNLTIYQKKQINEIL